MLVMEISVGGSSRDLCNRNVFLFDHHQRTI